MLVDQDRPYLVMGLLDSESIAWSIGQTLEAFGGKVVYAMQNERLRKIFFDRDRRIPEVVRAGLDLRYCDVTRKEEVKALFAECPSLAGVIHSIAYANPRTCLGESMHSAGSEDILQGFHISCASLATVVEQAAPCMSGAGAVLALTFDTGRVYPYYNWMGVNKAALEALVRALARQHGRSGVRVNAVSAGPLYSKAATKIPGFGMLDRIWDASSPLPWDPKDDRKAVAHAAAFLLGPLAAKITGQVLFVDGGASIVAGVLQPFEGGALTAKAHPAGCEEIAHENRKPTA